MNDSDLPPSEPVRDASKDLTFLLVLLVVLPEAEKSRECPLALNSRRGLRAIVSTVPS